MDKPLFTPRQRRLGRKLAKQENIGRMMDGATTKKHERLQRRIGKLGANAQSKVQQKASIAFANRSAGDEARQRERENVKQYRARQSAPTRSGGSDDRAAFAERAKQNAATLKPLSGPSPRGLGGIVRAMQPGLARGQTVRNLARNRGMGR